MCKPWHVLLTIYLFNFTVCVRALNAKLDTVICLGQTQIQTSNPNMHKQNRAGPFSLQKSLNVTVTTSVHNWWCAHGLTDQRHKSEQMDEVVWCRTKRKREGGHGGDRNRPVFVQVYCSTDFIIKLTPQLLVTNISMLHRSVGSFLFPLLDI